MEARRVEGSKLIDNIVYNIYQKDGNANVGVCLVIGENNRNNRNIRLRKLIGSNELSLIKSEIYGKNPVNLTGADLAGADLTGVDLTGVNLTGANLTGADLTGATLTDSNLTDSNLTGAVLTGATLTDANISFSNLTLSNLTNANLTHANLYVTDLTDANLIGAILTNSELIDTTLISAIISRNSLSSYQIENIFGTPRYIEELSQEQLSQEILRQEQRRQELLRQQRINLNNNNSNSSSNRSNSSSNSSNNSNNNSNNNYISQQQRETRITIPENLLNPVKKSNNSCPNFNELYEFIMSQNLSGMFFFIYKGSNRRVVDYGGPKRDVFDKILPVYTKKFFEEIEDNENYVILKEDVDMDTLMRETEQLILLASASETKIFLKIDPTLLSLLVESQQSFIKYFNNNKKNRFSKLYKEFNQYIEHSSNNSRLLKYKTNKRELILEFKSLELKNEELKKTLEQEIRFRIFAITRGFTNMQQFIHMFNFINFFYNISPEDSFITCVLKFDIETILKRIKLFKKIKINDFGDYHKEPIPLEQYVRLSQNKQNLFNDITIYNIVKNYPYLIPFLNFILGPESSDDDRKLFIQRLSGSSSYTGELIIYLSYLSHIEAGQLPFYFATCGKYLEIFINREQNRRRITSEAIRIQLFEDTGFGIA